MPPHTLFCTARAESTFGTVTLCNLGDSRMHYRRSCPQRFVNPMFPRLATLIIHRKIGQWLFSNGICFNSQPPEGGCPCRGCFGINHACFNSQPPEGDCQRASASSPHLRSFNSQPPEGGCRCWQAAMWSKNLFQLTAARRRLLAVCGITQIAADVSTHSRPKAAARVLGF